MTDPDLEYGHDYPPREWSVAEVADALSRHGGAAPLPTYDEEATWREIAANPATVGIVDEIRDHAERLRAESLPSLTASRFLEYEREGNRGRYEAAYFGRLRRLSSFTLATCLDRTEEYLDGVLDAAWALCEQSTWLLPAHLPDGERSGGLPTDINPRHHSVALFSARTALVLAEVDYFLGERLHPQLRSRIRREIERRVFTPYEKNDYPWLHPPVGNWCAVCNAGVVCAALYLLDDSERLARFVVRAADSLEGYLDSFDADGCSAEGIGYWNFGFGHYVALAAHLDAATGGEYSLLSPPVVADAARFPLRVELSPGSYPPFSDSRHWMDCMPFVFSGAGKQLNDETLVAAGRRAIGRRTGPYQALNSDTLVEAVRNLCWAGGVVDPSTGGRRTVDSTVPVPELREFFGGHDWWLARTDPEDPDGLVVAAKGGHNDEHHNHNDCGTFCCHYREETLLTDLGLSSYERDYFGDGRYDYFVTRSLGHSVPLIDGYEQRAGRTFTAGVLDRTETAAADAITLDLAGCYPDEAGLNRLVRRIELDRTASPDGRVVVTDTVEFADGGGAGDGEASEGDEGDRPDRPWESLLVSYYPMEETSDGVVVRGERGAATIRAVASDGDRPIGDTEDDDGTGVDSTISTCVERFEDAVDVTSFDRFEEDARDVYRARFEPTPGTCSLSLELRPRPP